MASGEADYVWSEIYSAICRSSGDDFRVLSLALKEIERLRAGQFRWIAVSEEKQPGHTEWILVRSGLTSMHLIRSDHVFRSVYTHWAPIPPLPERTQEEKDEKMFYQWLNNANAKGLIQAFDAGLKAARGEK